jgi:hypothetical protein
LDKSPAHGINLSISGSQSVPPRTGDPDANDLDRPTASLHVLAPCHRKSAVHEASDHIAIEPMSEHKQFLSCALRIAGEQPPAPRVARQSGAATSSRLFDLLVALLEGRLRFIERISYPAVRWRRGVGLQTPHPPQLTMYSLLIDAADLHLIHDSVIISSQMVGVQPVNASLGARFAE